jgi:predicted DNA-binding transcriptional regulator AlpA
VLPSPLDDLRARVEALAREVAALRATARIPERMKVAAVAQALGVSVATVNRRVQDGTFPAPEGWVGPHRVWNRAAVEEWIAQHATAPRRRQRRGVAAWNRAQHIAREEAKARREGGRS